MGIDRETEFKEELQVFGNEVEEAMQCFYAEQTIHNVARENANVHHALNRNAAFWNLTSRALQANAIIVLGRIFDRDRRRTRSTGFSSLRHRILASFQRRPSKSASSRTQANTRPSSCVPPTSRRNPTSGDSKSTRTSRGQSTTDIS